ARHSSGWQDHLDLGTLAGLAADAEAASRLLNEARHHREAQTGPFTGSLGRKERLRYSLDEVLRNALTIVPHSNAQERARWLSIGFAIDHIHRDQHPAPLRHRIARVDQQVQQCERSEEHTSELQSRENL